MSRFFLLLVLMLCSGLVNAEGRCPPGYAPSNNPDFVGCAPIYQSGYDSGYSPASSPKPPDPGPRWKFRWGAIVVDGKKGIFGGADGFERPDHAQKAAVKDCRKHGGKDCKLLIEYYNQCGALVWGDNKYAGYTGPEPDSVGKRAVESCNKETSNCRIYYMGCSYPVEAG
jgi:hypothetical protein